MKWGASLACSLERVGREGGSALLLGRADGRPHDGRLAHRLHPPSLQAMGRSC